MKKNFTLILIASVGALPFLPSCNNETADDKPQYDYKRDDSLSSDYLRELGSFRVGMEQIASLNESLSSEKYSYNSQMLNPTAKVSTYNNSKVQAVNLGIYLSDLSFASAFNQTQDMRNFTDAVFQIAQKLGIQSAFNKELFEQLTSSDTTIDKSKLFTKAFRHLQDNMHSNERSYLMALMIAGGWVESIYLASSVLKTKPMTSELNLAFFDNAYTYKNVRTILQVFQKDSKNCNEVLTEIDTINTLVSELIMNSKYGITPAQLEGLYVPLSSIRNKLTS